MSIYVGIGILIIGMIGSVVAGITPNAPLFGGLLIFAFLAYRQGNNPKSILKMCWKGAYSARVVIIFMLIIGVLTASWRSSGVIAFFVYYGVVLIKPMTFILIAFLLTSLLSYAVGSSFAVAASLGVIFMALARAGGVDELVMGGVVMSGIYVGDRGAPTSSCAMLVASATDTEHMDNVRRMLKYGLAPYLVTLAIYAILSLRNPIMQVDSSYLSKLGDTFVITPWALLPAAIMLVLPALKLDVMKSMLISIASAFAIALLVQHIQFVTLLKFLLTGYVSKNSFGTIFNGGGLMSMVGVALVVMLSAMYAGIFDETGMLDNLKDRLELMIEKTGRFFTTFVIGMLLSAVSCNQSFSTLMAGSLLGDIYEKSGGTKRELASDMQNSFIVSLALLPWVVACYGPLQFMDADFGSMKYACYIYLLPVIYAIEKAVAHKLRFEQVRKRA